MTVAARQRKLPRVSTTGPDLRFDDLRALFLNCTLKRSPELSHTQGLIDISAAIMRTHGVAVDRNTTFMTWNLLHLARMLKDAGGIPAHGNQRAAWDAGARFDFQPARDAA